MLKFTDDISNNGVWTNSELSILMDKYGAIGPARIGKFIPRHPISSIKKKAYHLGLSYKFKFVNVDFFNTWSERMAWCVGLIATDGNLYSAKRILNEEKSNENVRIDSVDYEIIRKFVSFTGSTYAIREYCIDGRKKEYQTQMTNKDLYYRMINLGLKERKSLDLQFPKDYPDEWMPGYTRGVWDGDGGVYDYGYLACKIGMGSINFIRGLDDYLTTFLNLSKHTINIRKTERPCGEVDCYYTIQLSSDNAIKLCRYMYHDNMQDAYLTRKYNVWLEYKRRKGI